MIVIDIYGTPGSGKSTLAAFVFSQLKIREVKCELVTEVAKDFVWDENAKALANQAYVFGSQFYKLTRIEGSVDVAVVDSPLLLSNLYNINDRLGSSFYKMVSEVSKSFDCLSYFLPVIENKLYDDVGRIHNEETSKKLSDTILMLLGNCNVDYKILGHDENSMMSVVDDVMNALNKG